MTMLVIIYLGYITIGVIAYLITLFKYLLPDDELKRYPQKKQRVFKIRRYALLPFPFVALWPIIVAFIVFWPIGERRGETKRAVKEMKGFIYFSEDDDLKSLYYDPDDESMSPNDTF